MAQVVDYAEVLTRMTDSGFVSLYHRSGAFGFADPAAMRFAGWIGPDDPSIRETAAGHITRFAAPYPATLADRFVRSWQTHLPGDLWLMPKSHWHYELHFGNRELLEPLLRQAGVDPSTLVDRNDGSAVRFGVTEEKSVGQMIERLLGGLRGSDFLAAFPDHQTLCTIHHHQQLWWQTSDQDRIERLRALAGQSTQSSSF